MNFVADYSRQLSLDWMSPSKQTAIIQSRILVFGAGGLGVAAISYLSGAGVGAITIVDFDRIEASNLHRQTIYQVSDIGHYKAIITASYITERNPNCDINAITEFLDLPELYQLCEKHDVILDCTDDQAFSFLLNAVCLACSKKVVFANAVKLEGQLFTLYPDTDNPCFRCLWPNHQSELSSCNQVGVMGPVPGALGCIQALEAIKIVAGQTSHLFGHLLHCDFMTYEFSKLKVVKRSRCNHQLVDADIKKEFDAYIFNTVPKVQELDVPDDILIDIRSKDEWSNQPSGLTTQHIELQQLSTKPEDFIKRELDYWLICSSGKRSKTLCDNLQKRGYRVSPCRLY